MSRKQARDVCGALLEIAGMTAITAGFFTIALWCGLIAAGIGLILMGMSVSPPIIRRSADL